MKFDRYSDPGHGWVKAPIDLLIELGILHKITEYSYKRGQFVYLEEDQDLTTFMEAMKANGKEVEYREHISDRSSRIRRYEPFLLGRA